MISPIGRAHKRYRDHDLENEQDSAKKFVQLKVNDPGRSGCCCEMTFPDGRALVFQQPVSAEFLKMLIG